MGLGGTAKKLQKIANMAEELYARVNDLREQLNGLGETVEQTNAAVEQLRREHAETRALVERLAENEGIDVDAVAQTNTGSPQPEQGQGPEDARDQRARGHGGRGTAPGSSSVDRAPGNE